MGSAVNYLVIGIALCSGFYDGIPQNEKAALVSKGSGVAISLVFGFTQIFQCAEQASTVFGHAGRSTVFWRGLIEVEAEVQHRTEREHAQRKRRVVTAGAGETRENDMPLL